MTSSRTAGLRHPYVIPAAATVRISPTTLATAGSGA
jgi:hypothetical protein